MDNLKTLAKGLVGVIEKAVLTLYVEGSDEIDMKFQFNPSSINISARGGGRKQRITNEQGKEDFSPQETKMYLNFQFIVDRTDVTNAFMFEKFSLTASRALNEIGSAIGNAINGKDNAYTVQPLVDGLVAALRSSGDVAARFTWNKMNYYGIINKIDSTYTMFNPSGDPIRAVIRISMTMATQKGTEDKPLDMIWAKKYQECIKTLQKDDSGGIDFTTSKEMGSAFLQI